MQTAYPYLAVVVQNTGNVESDCYRTLEAAIKGISTIANDESQTMLIICPDYEIIKLKFEGAKFVPIGE